MRVSGDPARGAVGLTALQCMKVTCVSLVSETIESPIIQFMTASPLSIFANPLIRG